MSELELESTGDSQSNEAMHIVVSQLCQSSDELTQSSDRNNVNPGVPCQSGYAVGWESKITRGTYLV